MKMIYVCSPYKGDVENNVFDAKNYCKEVIQKGHIPIASHLYFTQFLNDSIKEEREVGLRFGIEILKVCDEVWVCGDKVSKGMKQEIEVAIKLGKVVKYIE